MDYGHFIACCLLGIAAGLAVFFLLGARRREWIPPLAWWLCLGIGAVACMYGLFNSTVPSFANRITAVGKAYDYVDRETGNGHHRNPVYGFRFVPEGGQPIEIETRIILPNWNKPADFDGRTFRIVYLDDGTRTLKNEAIDIAILSGKHAGFHDSLDARPMGAWLGIPIGAALAFFGFFGLKYKKNDETTAESAEEADAPQT